MFKKIYLAISVIASMSLVSCDKEDNIAVSDKQFAQVSAYNFGLLIPRPVNFFVDNELKTNATSIAYLGNSTGTSNSLPAYFGATAGTHTIAVKDTASNNPAQYFSGSVNIEANKSYSAFIYDSLLNGNIKALFLTNDLTAPQTGNVHLRFLNLSPDPQVQPVDIWLFRRKPSGTGVDSTKLFSSVPYVGSTTPNLTTLSAFTPIAGSQVISSTSIPDTLKARNVGSITNLTTSVVTLVPSKIYTVVLRGFRTSGRTPALGLTLIGQN